MSLRVHTESGSVYELDEDLKRARRISGTGCATPRSEAWRAYETATITNEHRLLIVWTSATPLLPGSPPGMQPGTLTSTIICVEQREEIFDG